MISNTGMEEIENTMNDGWPMLSMFQGSDEANNSVETMEATYVRSFGQVNVLSRHR